MGAVGLVFGAKLCRHWRSWLLLTVLITIVGGFVLAAAAAGDRTDAVFPRYLARHGYDAIVYTSPGQGRLAPQPEIAQVVPVRMPFYDRPQIVKLVAGRLPDQSSPAEALASFTLQRDYGVRPGTVITLRLAGASQRDAVFKAMAGVLVTANVLAAIPALSAARARPGRLLRTE
jgi:hypothetical protein